jgi:hypothetical protein
MLELVLLLDGYARFILQPAAAVETWRKNVSSPLHRDFSPDRVAVCVSFTLALSFYISFLTTLFLCVRCHLKNRNFFTSLRQAA